MPAETKLNQFSLKLLARIINAEPALISAACFTTVSTDSRTTRPGECFFAIAGENFDGHDYVADAFAKGAACAVVDKDIRQAGQNILKVGDAVKALGDWARWYRREMNFNVVAITGSVGKTTTRQIIYHVLSRHFRVSQSPKNFNNYIGLPLTLLAARPDDEIVVAEIGANRPGEVSYLTRVACPDIALVTNVYPVHLSGFGDLRTIAREKLSIAEALRPDGTLIINQDCKTLAEACREKVLSFVSFGKSPASDMQVTDISHTGRDSSFTINGCRLTLPLLGLANVENACAACAVCSRFGITVEDFAHALSTLPAVPMRAELLNIGNLTILNDCYNANPASMKNALDILLNLAKDSHRRPVFICGDMAELGRQSDALHVELGRMVANAKVKLLITVGTLAKLTAKTARAAAQYNMHIESFDNTASLCNNLKELIKDSDIVLVKGSRSVGLEKAADALKGFFS